MKSNQNRQEAACATTLIRADLVCSSKTPREPFRVIRANLRAYLAMNAIMYGVAAAGVTALLFPELNDAQRIALTDDGTADRALSLLSNPWLLALTILAVNILTATTAQILLLSLILYARARELQTLNLEVFERAGAQMQVASASTFLSAVEWRAGDTEHGWHRLIRALSLFHSLTHPTGLTRTLGLASIMLLSGGPSELGARCRRDVPAGPGDGSDAGAGARASPARTVGAR